MKAISTASNFLSDLANHFFILANITYVQSKFHKELMYRDDGTLVKDTNTNREHKKRQKRID